MKHAFLALILVLLCATVVRADGLYEWSLSGGATGEGFLTLAPGMQSGMTCTIAPGTGYISNMNGEIDGALVTFVSSLEAGSLTQHGGCIFPEVGNYMMDLNSGVTTTLIGGGITWSLMDNSFANQGFGNVYLLANGVVLPDMSITITNEDNEDEEGGRIRTPEPSSLTLLFAGITLLTILSAAAHTKL